MAAHHSHKASLGALTVGALGVVFGDIGTSPLYTLKECLHSAGGDHPAEADLYGILSLIFWALTMVVTVKYLTFIMKADNRGEGGIFALLALVPERLRAARPGSISAGGSVRRAGSIAAVWRWRHHAGDFGVERGRGTGGGRSWLGAVAWCR